MRRTNSDCSNIGNDATALWRHYDDSVSEEFIAKRQAMHVSILSVGSFVGRLSSGKCTSTFSYAKLTVFRCWIRLSCQSLEGFPNMVPYVRLPYLPRCSAFCPLSREPALSRPRIRSYWIGLRIPLRMFPFDCCRNLWCAWAEHKLGMHDIISCHKREYLQPVLWHCV